MSKRKRSETDDVTTDGPRKTQGVEDVTSQTSNSKDAKAKAAARQAKSERRSKKSDKSKRTRPEPAALPDGIETLEAVSGPSTHATDPFATNDETIPLVDESNTDARPTKRSKSNPKPKPTKTTKTPSATAKPGEASSTNANHRFILFIGNLPYSTTTDSLNHHFRALQPFTVRHSTEKANPKRSKGFAFLEFTSYDRMKTCLKLYHHSLFDPEAHLNPPPPPSPAAKKTRKEGGKEESDLGPDVPAAAPGKDDTPQWRKAPRDKTRRINVELTAGGGGGKSTARKDKIRNKNAKLAEERERVHKREVEEREKKEREGGRGRGRPGEKAGTGANADTVGDSSRGNVHPSRMRHVRG